MKNNVTELVFILDKSGSMAGLEKDTIGGFNAMIEKQKKEDGACYVSTVLFSDESQMLHDRLPLEQVPQMTDRDYEVCGCTALLDAIGDCIRHIENIHKYARAEDLPAHTLFVITTDGQENASHRYTGEKIKKMIGRQKEKYGWEFLFIGANIDAVATASRYGIEKGPARCFGRWATRFAASGTNRPSAPTGKERSRRTSAAEAVRTDKPVKKAEKKTILSDGLFLSSIKPRHLHRDAESRAGLPAAEHEPVRPQRCR